MRCLISFRIVFFLFSGTSQAIKHTGRRRGEGITRYQSRRMGRAAVQRYTTTSIGASTTCLRHRWNFGQAASHEMVGSRVMGQTPGLVAMNGVNPHVQARSWTSKVAFMPPIWRGVHIRQIGPAVLGLKEAGRRRSMALRYSDHLSTRLTQALSRLAGTLAAPMSIYT
jgi:hypothetical protein